jgi:queuine tRNA-ribosyltransferase
MLRPGDAYVAEVGGLHAFAGNRGAILTDSGGFQVFSLAGMRKVTDEGVTFRSHLDGSKHFLSPERLVELQENLGPDIAMVLDECPPAQAERDVVEAAVARTTQWAERALAARKREDVAWFGIVQGALFEDLRAAHVETISSMPFDGFAVGGVSVGEAPEDIDRIVRFTTPLLPEDKPRYLMGVGTPGDLVRGVASGIDMFDCVMPTRNARNGTLFVPGGKLSIKRRENRDDMGPVDSTCSCECCTDYSRAFMRHLFASKEITYTRLATLHNLTFYMRLMEGMRRDLEEGSFDPAKWLDWLGEPLGIWA